MEKINKNFITEALSNIAKKHNFYFTDYSFDNRVIIAGYSISLRDDINASLRGIDFNITHTTAQTIIDF